MVLLYLLIGGLAGGLLTTVGMGAGLIIIPALIYLAHFDPKTAIGTSLTILLPPVGFFAVLTYWRQGHVDVKAALFIIIGFVICSWFAAKLATGLPVAVLERSFGVVAILIGLKMLFSA